MNKWLLLDCHYLCYRAFHTTGHLSFNDVKTGVIFGFLRDLSVLQDVHGTDRLVFCFDSQHSKRQQLYEPYKRARRERFEKMDEEELVVWQEMRNQIVKLRREYLPAIGFKNILVQRGYEADDMIASVVYNNLPETGDEAVIIASDKDLYQLLGPLVTMWNPVKKKATTARSFRQEWRMDPMQWAKVKALAGCPGDGVEGIKGVGEKTAAKWVRGELDRSSKIFQRILDDLYICNRNMPLVSLPFEGVKHFSLVDDDITKDKWHDVADELGISSISMRTTKRRTTKEGGFGL